MQDLAIWVNESDRLKLIDAMDNHGSVRDFEVLSRRKNGEIFWNRLSASLIEIEGEHCRITFAREITEVKAAEERLASATAALLASEERYRTVFHTSLDCITLSHLSDGRYVDVNKAFLDLIGIEPEEIVGRTSRELGIWADPEARAEIVELLRRNSSFRDYQTQFVKRSGEKIWVLISAAVIEIGGIPCIVSAVRDISGAKAAESTIHSLALYDPLTGLPNRRLLFERLGQALAGENGTDGLKALLLIDLDNLKTLNDTLGHHVGDLVLQEAARRIAACAHEADTVGRLGGDEFVVIVDGLSQVAEEAATQAKAIGQEILDSIDQPYLLENRESLTAASMGVTIFGHQEKTADEILQKADIALHLAKADGRNTLRFFSPALQAVVNAQAELDNDLRLAIKKKEFVLYYQPQVERGRMTGAEALIRWNHPHRGLVSPDEFIPFAEETRLILPLGDWVLETACSQIAAWSGRPETARLTIAVNISALQFRQPEFVEHVLAAIALTGADPRLLKLELTESMLVENVEDVIAKMTELKSHGLSFSLDDFGTGYSSLAYLKRLPLDQLKIDRSFVRDMLVDLTSGAIAQTIISLGRAMELSVVAEGVETEEQRGFLAGLGCHCFQGYLVSPALPREQFEALL
jgi:diguanylate cyclase (GGDEF)-like protein/PAS domain S-box-containing protein